MYLIALFAFVAAALLGLTMAVMHFRGTPSGRAIGIAHGLLAASGLVLLGVGLASVEAGPAWWIFAGFLAVATGGVYLFTRQARDEPWPGAVIAVHGGLALTMIVVLGLWVAGRDQPLSDDRSVPAATTEHEPVPVEELTE